eukprot:TRINITY_DN21634_c0_g1_i1.p1 TRINITY_DN21634_c0_g1~~TRINITY_DN21634_c0_g1_i1.p1  ORF type:complete len:108 (-),score=5.52 TRINITY_DN21634_c0_g1_i1:215-538(-)
MIRRPPRSTLSSSSAASDVYKRQSFVCLLLLYVLLLPLFGVEHLPPKVGKYHIPMLSTPTISSGIPTTCCSCILTKFFQFRPWWQCRWGMGGRYGGLLVRLRCAPSK